MGFRIQLFELIHEYFPSFTMNSECRFPGKRTAGNPFPMEKKSVASYDLYSINSPFNLYLIDYRTDYSTHLILNAQTCAISNSPNSTLRFSHLHRHNYFELACTLSGQVDFLIEGVHKRCYAGDACLLNYNTRHVEEYNGPYTAVYLEFKPEYFKEIQLAKAPFLSHELLNFFQKSTADSEQINYLDFSGISGKLPLPVSMLLYNTIRELFERAPGFEDILSGFFKRLLFLLQQPSLYTCSNICFQLSDTQDIFDRTLTWLHENKRKVSRAELAEALHYNGNYIARVFLNRTGQTLASYIRNLYLTEAADLLLNTTLNISEIILQLGFENRSAFYHQFKGKYGVTPDNFRKQKNEPEH